MGVLACVCVREREGESLWPVMDEFELHGLLFLDRGQKFFEVFTLLCDVAVLHLLLLAAVTTDQLWPLFSVQCCDVLYLHTHTHLSQLALIVLTADRFAVAGFSCKKLLPWLCDWQPAFGSYPLSPSSAPGSCFPCLGNQMHISGNWPQSI